jgi:hypothetical protein
MVQSSLPRARRLLLRRRSWLLQLRSFAALATAGIRASVAASFCEASANQVSFHTNLERRISAGLFFLRPPRRQHGDQPPPEITFASVPPFLCSGGSTTGLSATDADEVKAGTHRPRAPLRTVFAAMGDVTFPEVVRQPFFDRPRNQSCRELPEQSASLTIGVSNPWPSTARIASGNSSNSSKPSKSSGRITLATTRHLTRTKVNVSCRPYR